MSKANVGLIASSFGALFLVALGACSDTRHPLDRQLSQMKPVAVALLQGLERPKGTLLCPLSPYQSELSGDSATTQRINAFLRKKHFRGDEAHWSLVVVSPALTEAPVIEHLIFERGNYDVVTSLPQPDEATEPVLAKFQPKECVEIQEARILATHGGALHRTQIRFGTSRPGNFAGHGLSGDDTGVFVN